MHFVDLGADLVGRLGRLGGQTLDLGCDHGKAASRLARARAFNGGVQRQEVGLGGDVGDQIDHLANLFRRTGKLFDGFVGRLRLGDGLAGNIGRVIDLVGDLGDRLAHLVSAGGHDGDIGGRLLGGRGDVGGAAGRLGGRARHGAGGSFQFGRRMGDRAHDLGHAGLELVSDFRHRLALGFFARLQIDRNGEVHV